MDDFKVGNFNVWLTLVALVSLVAASFYELNSLLGAETNSNEQKIKQEIKETLLFILLVASTAYGFIFYSFFNTGQETFETRNIRYLDWIITTPLLTYTFYLFVTSLRKESDNYEKPKLLGRLLTTNLLFVAFGIVSEFVLSTSSYSKSIGFFLAFVSFIFYGLFLFLIFDLLKLASCGKDFLTNQIEYFFFIGWTLYGVVFALDVLKIMDRKIVVSVYTLLDFINKVIYSFALGKLLYQIS